MGEKETAAAAGDEAGARRPSTYAAAQPGDTDPALAVGGPPPDESAARDKLKGTTKTQGDHL